MTTIEWTDVTWNPVTGCTKVSQGCKHCYAERVFPRAYAKTGRQFTDVRTHPERLDQPLRWKTPRRVFVNSMSDLFHEDVPPSFIERVWITMRGASRHTFQILTKRPKRALSILSSATFAGMTPPPHIWLGVSVEDQATADERIPLLLQTPAAVRFVSYEPALGPVKFGQWLCGERAARGFNDAPAIGWVIVGGESGPKARLFDVEWARSTILQCKAASVPVFIKQLGAESRGWCGWNAPEYIGSGEALTMRADGDDAECVNYGAHEQAKPCASYNARCVMLLDRKGGDPSEWPVDLRVREFPA